MSYLEMNAIIASVLCCFAPMADTVNSGSPTSTTNERQLVLELLREHVVIKESKEASLEAIFESKDSRFSSENIRKLSQLNNLKSIVVINATVTSDALAEMSRIRTLEKLYISSGPLSQRDWRQISVLDALRDVTVYECDCAGMSDNPVVLPKRLERAAFVRCTMSSVAWSTAPNLSELRIIGSEVSDAAIHGLEDAKSLSLFLCQSSSITDKGIERLGVMRKLRILDLQGCKYLTDDSVATLIQCRHLERLSINQLRITDSGITKLIAKWPKSLVYIDVGNTRITSHGISLLTQSDIGVRTLLLEAISLNDDVVRRLARCRKMENLRLIDAGLLRRHMRVLSEMIWLKTLDVSKNDVSPIDIEELRGKLPTTTVIAK